jgi:hypothetical protein
MTNFSATDAQLKEALKNALVEVLTERREIFVEVFAEVLEDLGLARAIEAEQDSETVSRDAIFKILDGEV